MGKCELFAYFTYPEWEYFAHSPQIFDKMQFLARKKDGETTFLNWSALGSCSFCELGLRKLHYGWREGWAQAPALLSKNQELRFRLVRHMHRSDTTRVVFPGHINKAGVLHKASQPLLIRKRLDAFR